MKPYYKKPPAPPSPPKGTYYDMVEEALQARFTTTQHTTMKPQPNLDALIADHLAKFEAEKPYLEVLYAKEARGI